MMIATEHPFTLPIGYLDDEGTLHREGVMRMATAGDEILPLKDHRVQANEAYLIVILLSRVITHLGTVPSINPKVIENLYAGDLAFLQDFYNQVNRTGNTRLHASCPRCEHEFDMELSGVGGS
ncbi:hypothetical protein GCM10011579_093990 [Streptomyces albiflavescens]|uniref:Secreted protein n=1 Tax=Streptomyces albiflavescens TaxID=1623582 RepID=A0A917YGS8_9ACTN|nr:hypothetical protein GCM10011579_093990 [Streptomyces albiflavescens]